MKPALLLSALFTACLAAQPALDETVSRTLKEFDVPGIAVGIVKDGQLVFAKGYGVRRLGEAAPVTPKTLFGVASNTKAFTAAALAILADEGKLKWEDPVQKHLPAFQMWDPYVTREMTVRDLLVHRSGLGLGAGDLMFFPPTELTRAEIVQRLRYVRPSTSFRSRYNYDNILYIVAGQVVEAVSGVSWDQFLKDRIFTPLGMTATVTSVKEFKPGTDYASPHAKGDTKLQPVELSQADNWGAAAAIQSSVEDMAKWVAVQLDRGDMGGGKRLFSAAQSREMWTPQTLLPSREPSGPTAAIAPNMSAYALGWNVSDYRGKKMIHHTGGLAGMVTRVTLIPDLKLGVMVFTNQEVGAAFNAVTYTALDYYLGATGTDWVAVLGEQARKQAADAESAVAAAAAKRNANSKPSLPLTSYAGRYRDPWYGDVLVEEKEGRLAIRFTHSPVLVGFLEHFQYDTFVARWNDRTLLADAYMTFSLKDDGTIDAVKMRAVSPATDFSYDFHDLDLRPAPKDAKPY